MEHIHRQAGLLLLPLLLAMGCFSAISWQQSEIAGAGDLRLYLLVQFFPMVLIPLIIIGWKSRWSRQYDFFNVLGFYLLAKIFEFFDETLFNVTGQIISGHSLKHLMAALAIAWCFRILTIRERLCRT